MTRKLTGKFDLVFLSRNRRVTPLVGGRLADMIKCAQLVTESFYAYELRLSVLLIFFPVPLHARVNSSSTLLPAFMG
jgi:hypothetical protein